MLDPSLLAFSALESGTQVHFTVNCYTFHFPVTIVLCCSVVSDHGIFQASVLEWVAISFSKLCVVLASKPQEEEELAESRIQIFLWPLNLGPSEHPPIFKTVLPVLFL